MREPADGESVRHAATVPCAVACRAVTWKGPRPKRPSGARRSSRAASREQPPAKKYPAVYGCTEDDPEPHFLGWRVEVDPDELFASGKAWGVTVRRVAAVADA